MKFLVYENNWNELQARITSLNKQLTKAGQPAVTMTIEGHEDEPHPEKANQMIRRFVVEATGTEPVYNGWHFIATMVHTSDGNIVRAVPGHTVNDKYRNGVPYCEHCQTNRRRKDTYILRHDDGNEVQVGSSCMRDFLKHEDKVLCRATELILRAYDAIESATRRNWLGGVGGEPWRINKHQFLAQVAQVVAVEGKFITRKVANEQQRAATANTAYSIFFSAHPESLASYAITPEAAKFAEDACTHIIHKYAPHLTVLEGDDNDIKDNMLDALVGSARTLTDFEHSLLAVARAECIEPRLIGIAAYVVEAYRRHLLEQKSAVESKSVHVGKEGERLRNLKLEILGCTYMPSQFNEFGSTFIRMKDATGNIFTWKASGSHEYARGASVVVTGTVKKHSDYKGVLQTELSRCKLEVTGVKTFGELVA